MVRYILRENRYLDIYPGKTIKILIVKKRGSFKLFNKVHKRLKRFNQVR